MHYLTQMGCPALGGWVACLKQPKLPGKAPQAKKKIITNKSKVVYFIFWGSLSQVVHQAV
jgi:hypothetical protein